MPSLAFPGTVDFASPAFQATPCAKLALGMSIPSCGMIQFV
jgi:hypothetical protein